MIAGFDVNDARGDAIRTDLWHKTAKVLDCLDLLGVHTPNRSGLPVIEVPLARHEEIGDVGRFLFDQGIYVTLAAYPLVPKSEVGFRIQTTAANTHAEIDAFGGCARTARRAVRPAAGATRGTCGMSTRAVLAGSIAPSALPTTTGR